MNLLVTKKVGKIDYPIQVEATPVVRGLWRVNKTAMLVTKKTERVYARNGDLIRLVRKTTRAGIKEVYSVYDLATARRAERLHIQSSIGEALKRVDYWIRHLSDIRESLEDWKQLSEADIQLIIRDLGDFRNAFLGKNSWQQELALQKVTNFQDLRDKRLRRNPQAAIRSILSARMRLLEYRRVLEKSVGVNTRLAATVELTHSTYKRRFAELREQVRLGFSPDPQKSQERISRISERLSSFTLNPWLRPAQESMRFLALSERLYREGDRYEANRLLRAIPILFSCESRMTKAVEIIHSILDYGAKPDVQTALLAADRLYPLVKVFERIERNDRAGSYQNLARDLVDLITDAELAFRVGQVSVARNVLREIERRIRAR